MREALSLFISPLPIEISIAGTKLSSILNASITACLSKPIIGQVASPASSLTNIKLIANNEAPRIASSLLFESLSKNWWTLCINPDFLSAGICLWSIQSSAISPIVSCAFKSPKIINVALDSFILICLLAALYNFSFASSVSTTITFHCCKFQAEGDNAA